MTNDIYDKNGNAASEMTANTAIKKPERISPIEKLTAKIRQNINARNLQYNLAARKRKRCSQSIWQPIINKGKRKSRIDFVW